MRILAVLCVVLAGCTTTVTMPTGGGSPVASGLDPIDAVLAAFAEHRVVAFGERHGSESQHEFLQGLIADPRLVGVVNDIAVEFGSARHQQTIDRFTRGEPVPKEELERVWTDTTQQSGVWNSPVYRQLFELIRDLNRRRNPEMQLRVLLGDPPIDWDQITATTNCNPADPACLDYWIGNRDEHFASVLLEQSIERGRRALVIAGSGHILRNPAMPGVAEPISLTDLLDATEPGLVWSLVAVDATAIDDHDVSSPPPVVVELLSSPVGGLLVDDVFARGTVTCDHPPCETPVPRTLRQAADALLLL